MDLERQQLEACQFLVNRMEGRTKPDFPNAETVPWSSGILVTKLCPTPVTPWTVAYQAPLFTGFPRQEY